MFAFISGCGAQPKPSIGWPQSPRSQKEIENGFFGFVDVQHLEATKDYNNYSVGIKYEFK